jgi:uncharacterized protein YacL
MRSSTLLWVIRALFVIVLAGVAARICTDYSANMGDSYGWWTFLLFCGIMAVGGVAIAIDAAYPDKRIRTISCVYFGLLVGSLLSHLLNLAFGPTLGLWSGPRLQYPLSVPFSLLTSTILCYICVSFLLQTHNDIRFIIPYVEFQRQVKGPKPLVLDSSVIIDGRIADLADTGMLSARLIVPRFVLQEVQNIADSQDKTRRNRGRRGLDVLDRLHRNARVEVENLDDPAEGDRAGSDHRLIAIARSVNGKIVTNDFNLSKLARLQDVETVNINEVSSAVKPPAQWGDQLTIKLVKEGEGQGQGVGYLDDGTMVVAEAGRGFIGQEVSLVVTSVLQTNAGRMIFGRLDHRHQAPAVPSGPAVPPRPQPAVPSGPPGRS